MTPVNRGVVDWLVVWHSRAIFMWKLREWRCLNC